MKSVTFKQADQILKVMDMTNASYPLTHHEMKRIRSLIYLACVFGLIDGFSFQWFIHGPYNKPVNDFLMHLVKFTQEHPLEEWYEK